MKFRPDPSFRYTPAFETDVRKTFARIRASLLNQESIKADTRSTIVRSMVGSPMQPKTTEPLESAGRK